MRYTFILTSLFLVFGIVAATDAQKSVLVDFLDDAIQMALENNREIPTT